MCESSFVCREVYNLGEEMENNRVREYVIG